MRDKVRVRPGSLNAITDVPGLKVGHYEDTRALTGTTVVVVERGAVGAVDVRGAAPGTRETDLLEPGNLVEAVHAVVLSGGSAFGLEAAGGVVRYLEERRIGFPVGEGQVVPIVPAAILFDLGRGADPRVRPDGKFGYRAAQRAASGPVAQGNVGAGTGAVAGGIKGGVGSASAVLESGLVVGALAVVNAWGKVYDPRTGRLYGAFLELDGEFGLDPDQRELVLHGKRGSSDRGAAPGEKEEDFYSFLEEAGGIGRHTTLGVVATNARLTKAQARKVAQMAHDGLARAIRPVHTLFDGDAVFALATGEVEAASPGDVTVVGAIAADVMARAVVHAVLNAESSGGFQSYRDRFLRSLSP